MDMNGFMLIGIEIEYKTKVFKYLRHVIMCIYVSAAKIQKSPQLPKKSQEILVYSLPFCLFSIMLFSRSSSMRISSASAAVVKYCLTTESAYNSLSFSMLIT